MERHVSRFGERLPTERHVSRFGKLVPMDWHGSVGLEHAFRVGDYSSIFTGRSGVMVEMACL